MDTSVVTLAVPQLPAGQVFGMWADCAINTAVYRALGWRKIQSIADGCDLIHSVGAVGAGVVASAWARRAGKHHVTQLVGSDVNVVLPRIASAPVIATWDKHLHGVACNSRALMASFAGLYPRVPNVRTVPRGVDLELFNPEGPPMGPLAALPPVRFFFLGGFLLHRRLPSGLNIKGLETVLSAWHGADNELAKAGASLAIAGPGSDSERVQRWRMGLGHPENVHILGAIRPADVPGHIRAADVVLVPSLAEGLPNVCMEAAACGRAVFGTLTGGIPEAVADRESGVLLPGGEPDEWRRALLQYATQPHLLRDMGHRGRRRMEELFDARTYPEQMAELYRAAVALPVKSR